MSRRVDMGTPLSSLALRVGIAQPPPLHHLAQTTATTAAIVRAANAHLSGRTGRLGCRVGVGGRYAELLLELRLAATGATRLLAAANQQLELLGAIAARVLINRHGMALTVKTVGWR